MEISFPCEPFARLTSVLKYMPSDASKWFNSVRLEDGMMIASNRQFIVVERVFGMQIPRPIHIVADPKLIEQCRTEGKFESKCHVVVNDMMKFASLKTTLGYMHAGNAALWIDFPNDMDRWKSLLPEKLADKTNGGMYLDTEQVSYLIESSPTGKIVFPEMIDVTTPCIVRDINDDRWFAMFIPKPHDKSVSPAVYPGWWKDTF